MSSPRTSAGWPIFYTDVFGCELVPPERDYAGDDLSRGTGVPDAALRGAHLRLPGGGPDGPTIEIYTYSHNEPRLPAAANRLGWGPPRLPGGRGGGRA